MKVTPILPTAGTKFNLKRPICYGVHVNRATVFYEDGTRKEFPSGADGMRQAWNEFETGRKGILS